MSEVKEIELNFTYKGDEFKRIDKNGRGYIYERIHGLKKYYEVFEIKESEILSDFEKKIGSGEFKHRYPKDEDFGKWAWCCGSIDRAFEILNDL